MSYTNSTPNYDLPQWIGTDKPTFLGDFNGAFSAIDTAIKNASDTATSAASTANAASATANSANTNANTALSTANNAKDTADAATSAAAAATSTANDAKTTANNAAHAALGNSIENLAPAYDPTLTYDVGDLVTYIDENNSGKLYKCIIAVNTPMAFNVNYWDDVTVSETLPKERVIAEVAADGVKTHAQLLSEISADPNFAALSRDDLINTKLLYSDTSYDDILDAVAVADGPAATDKYVEYVQAHMSGSSDTVFIRCRVGVGSGATGVNERSRGDLTTSGYSKQDQSSAVAGSTIKYRVVIFK